MNAEWLTTNPHPTSPAHTAVVDCGQVGWRLHYVRLGVWTQKHPTSKNEIDVSPALCGITPKHGWGLDMFVDLYCESCKRIAATDEDKQE